MKWRTPLFIELTAKLINKQKGNTTTKKNKVIGLNTLEETGNNVLSEILRKGAQKILKEALEIEIETFIAEYKDLRTSGGKRELSVMDIYRKEI